MKQRCEEEKTPSTCSLYSRVVHWTRLTSPEESKARFRQTLHERCLRDDYTFEWDCSELVELAIEEDKPRDPYEKRLKGWCEDDNYLACYWLGMAIQTAAPPKEDEATKRKRYERAIPYLEKSCEEGNNGSACKRLLFSSRSKRGLPDTLAERKARAKASCESGSVSSCNSYGWMLLNEVEEDEEPDKALIQEVKDFFEAGCAYPYHSSCKSLAIISLRHRGKMSREASMRYSHAILERSCVEGKDRGSCDWLGFHYEHAIGTGKDTALARKYYHAACADGLLSGCRNFLHITPGASGTKLLETFLASAPDEDEEEEKQQNEGLEQAMTTVYLPGGKKIDSDDNQTLEHMQQSVKDCKREPKECRLIEQRFNKLVKTALITFIQQCDKGDGNSCWYASEILFNELGNYVFDRAEIMRLLELGCEAGEMRSCSKLGKRHFYSYWDEDSRPQDAHVYLDKACKERGKSWDCRRALMAAVIEEDDLEYALTAMEPMCEENELSKAYCKHLTGRYLYFATLNAPEVVTPHHEKRCEEEDYAPSCAFAARQWFAKNPALASELIPETCKEDTPAEICIERGWQLLQTPETSSEGTALLQEWCERDYGSACYELGLYYGTLSGLGNQVKSREALERSCSLSHPLACFQLGELYHKGNEHLEVDLVPADRHYLKACRLDHRASCKLTHDIKTPEEEEAEQEKEEAREKKRKKRKRRSKKKE